LIIVVANRTSRDAAVEMRSDINLSIRCQCFDMARRERHRNARLHPDQACHEIIPGDEAKRNHFLSFVSLGIGFSSGVRVATTAHTHRASCSITGTLFGGHDLPAWVAM
jgi:hypothetical protein